ncbi:hypothetical protein [Nocardia sp. AG03]|uniref:hypothetical protein n=1 Tax=Nocardia sp. AG03 TaxID=3025312 RepID=UPI0024186DD7|nr:hypothetical protein [Nocardia sp. AG03]
MATVDRLSQIESSIAAAKSRLDSAIDELKVQLEQYKTSAPIPADQVAEMQQEALSGTYGGDMNTAAALVASGAETWENLCGGESSSSELVSTHMDSMNAQYGGPAKAELSADPSFDPFPSEYYNDSYP